MSPEGFMMSLQTACLFFRYCRRYHVTDLKERTNVIRRIVAKGDARYLRDPKEFLDAKRREGKRIIQLNKPEDLANGL